MCKETLLGLYSSTNIIRKIDKECVVGGVCSTSGGDTCTNLVCEPEEERPRGRLTRKWCNNIKIYVNKKVQLDATICRHLFTAKSLYMFRASQHPSSGALKTVTATSGIYTAGTATSFQRGLLSSNLWSALSNVLTKSNHCIFLLHFNYFIIQKLLNYKIRYVDTSECVNI